jgi:hypothetical protein
MRIRIPVAFGVLAALASLDALGDDWPMWRHDPGRTTTTPGSVPEKLHLQWTLELPPLKPAYRDHRLQVGLAYQPMVTCQRGVCAAREHRQ